MTGPVVCDRFPASVPPTGSVLLDALLGGQCTGWQVQYIQTGSFPEVLSLNDFAASFWPAVAAVAVCDCEDVAASLASAVAAAANAASATLLLSEYVCSRGADSTNGGAKSTRRTHTPRRRARRFRGIDTRKAPAQVGPEHKGRQGEALVYDVHRMSVLGKSPKEARARIRAALEPGFHICRSGKKVVRCKCYLLPGVDYMDYTFDCNALPQNQRMTEFVGYAHVMVCERGRTRPRLLVLV